MRPYYIYGKLTRDFFHLTASLNYKAPKGYYAIRIIEAKSSVAALMSVLVDTDLQLPKPNELTLDVPHEVQASFIHERK